MSKISWWSKFCALPRFSFLLAEGPSVRKVHDTCGNWIDQSAASQIVDDMQVEINALRERLERLKPEEAQPQVPEGLIQVSIDLLDALDNKVRACNRTEHHHAKEILAEEAVEALDYLLSAAKEEGK